MIKARKMRKVVDDLEYTSLFYRMNDLSSRVIVSSSLFFAILLVTICLYYVDDIAYIAFLFYMLPLIILGFCISLSAVNLSRDIEYEREYEREFAEKDKKSKNKFTQQYGIELEKELNDSEEAFSYYTSRAKICSLLYACSFFIILILMAKVWVKRLKLFKKITIWEFDFK